MTPVPLGSRHQLGEGTDGVEEATALLPSLRVSEPFAGHVDHRHREEEWDIEPIEEEESD